MRALLQHDRLVALLVAAGTFLVFHFSPVRQVSDSAYALLVSERLLQDGELYVENFIAKDEEWQKHLGADIYNFEPRNGHLYYFFPNAGPVLAVPFVAALRSFGFSSVGTDGTWDRFGEVQTQGVIASILMAAFIALVYLTSRLVADRKVSLGVAFVSAFGTQVWSTTSRVMWSDTWGILLLMLVVWATLRQEVTGRAWNVLLHGTVLAWVYFVRPTNSVHIVFALLYLALLSWRRAVAVGAISAAWLAAFIVHSSQIYDGPVPTYFLPHRLTASRPLASLAGNLISPSRGFLVCVPVALFVLYLLAAYRKRLPKLRFVPIAMAACMAHFIPILMFEHWWGGHSYGSRLTTGLLPWAVVLGAIAVATWRAAHPERWPRFERVAAIALTAASIFVNGRGALVWDGMRWNYRPASVDLEPQRLWSWRHPQWLAGIVNAPDFLRFPTLGIGENLEFGDRASERFLGDGWSYAERRFRWSEYHTVWVGFGLAKPQALILRMMLQPGPSWRNDPGGQQLHVEINGRVVSVLSLANPSPAVYAIGLGSDVLGRRNQMRLHVPDPTSEKSEPLDNRGLRTAAYWLRLDAYPSLEDGETVDLGNPFLGSYLGSGWGEGEEHYRWTVGSHADMFFRRAGTGARVIDLTMHPFLSPLARAQRVQVGLNGVLTHLFSVDDLGARRYSLPFTGETLREFNVLGIDLLDAHAPASAGIGPDKRRLGVALHSIAVRRFPALPDGETIPWASPAAEPFLADGWSAPEPDARWNSGLSAGMVFSVPEGVNQGTLVFDWEPFVVTAAFPSQQVRVKCNDVPLGTFTLAGPKRRRTAIPIPAGALKPDNFIVFSFPDARSPRSLGLSPDPRPLAVKVHSVALHTDSTRGDDSSPPKSSPAVPRS